MLSLKRKLKEEKEKFKQLMESRNNQAEQLQIEIARMNQIEKDNSEMKKAKKRQEAIETLNKCNKDLSDEYNCWIY